MENSSVPQLANEEVGVQASKPDCFLSHSSLRFVTVQACYQEDFSERANTMNRLSLG